MKYISVLARSTLCVGNTIPWSHTLLKCSILLSIYACTYIITHTWKQNNVVTSCQKKEPFLVTFKAKWISTRIKIININSDIFSSYTYIYQFLHSTRTISSKTFMGRLSPCLQTTSWLFGKSCTTWRKKRWTIKECSLRRFHWWHSWSMKPRVPINFIKNFYLQSNTNSYSIYNVIFREKHTLWKLVSITFFF